MAHRNRTPRFFGGKKVQIQIELLDWREESSISFTVGSAPCTVHTGAHSQTLTTSIVVNSIPLHSIHSYYRPHTTRTQQSELLFGVEVKVLSRSASQSIHKISEIYLISHTYSTIIWSLCVTVASTANAEVIALLLLLPAARS